MCKKNRLIHFLVVVALLGGVLVTGTAFAQEDPIKEAAQEYFGSGIKLMTAEVLFENLNDGDESNDPVVIDCRKPEDFALGHIPGAVNIQAGQLFTDEVLSTLPKDKQIVTLCYTGQTSGQTTAALNMLGYDAYSLKFGMPSWALVEGVSSGPWRDDMSMGYPVEVSETAAGVAEGSEFEMLANLIDTRLAEWTPTISADALFENLMDGDESNDPLVLSVRAREHYDKGHIPGAYNIPWKQIADPDNLAKLPKDKQIVVYCYTGHTGQVAATILNVLGYNVINLKFGMMGWNDDPEVLAQDPFVEAAGYPVESEAHELTVTYDYPVLDTGLTDPAAIAQARAQAFLANWAPTTSVDQLFENLMDGDDANNPFVLSVRAREHYDLGHVPGAYNIPWKQIAKLDNLKMLPDDMPIVVYCYTGHTGQIAATVLTMLGYDATNMKFGMMGWTDDLDVLAQEPFAGAPDYPVETEANEF